MANRTTPTITTFQALGVASQFGITLAICVVLGYFAGHWLDDRLHTAIIFTLIGVLVGLVAAVLNTVRLYRALMDKVEFDTHAQTTRSAPGANAGDPLDEEPD
ncbi:MAG: AtpZ/AtpI family protein [Chloroflexi bacterium]|nr:AtpZ/AtpI family protein [Chloroflexota bacterium]